MQFANLNTDPNHFAQTDLGLRCLLTESMDTVVYVDEQRMSRSHCARSTGSSLFAYGRRAFPMLRIICRIYLCTKCFIKIIDIKKIEHFLFSMVKMAAKYAKIDRVDSLYASFSISSTCSKFLKISQYCYGTSIT